MYTKKQICLNYRLIKSLPYFKIQVPCCKFIDQIQKLEYNLVDSEEINVRIMNI